MNNLDHLYLTDLGHHKHENKYTNTILYIIILYYDRVGYIIIEAVYTKISLRVIFVMFLLDFRFFQLQTKNKYIMNVAILLLDTLTSYMY